MGAVYAAVHEETQVRYALKMLLPEQMADASPADIARFQIEAQAMAKLDHPHVARIHSAQLQGSQVYLVQEFCTGGTLQARGAATPRAAAEIALQLARGLAHCHERGVLHRDLKPENVLLDEQGVPKLVDFGLARVLESAQRLTQTGALLGTPGYMAPEQATGKGPLDARTDVFGLGGILYFLLCGHAPAEGPNLFATLTRVLEHDPPAPSRLRAGVPARLEAICLRALARSPHARYPDMPSFAAALEEWIQAPLGSPRRRGPALAVAGAAALGVALAVSGLLDGQRSAPPPVASLAPSATPTPDAARASPSEASPAPPPLDLWVQRFRDDSPPARRLSPDVLDVEDQRQRSEADQLAARWELHTLSSRDAVSRATPLAQAGSTTAQFLLAQVLLRGGDPAQHARAVDYMWESARDPDGHDWARVTIAEVLLADGQVEGARWATAAAAARFQPRPKDWDKKARLCCLSIRLDTPGDLGRALRLARPGRTELHSMALPPDPRDLNSMRWLLCALQVEGEPAALIAASTSPELQRATRALFARHARSELRALAQHASLADVVLPSEWVPGPPLEETWTTADSHFRKG